MLIVCPKCRRHVMHEEERCPFCGDSHDLRKLSVATVLALSVVSAVACSGGGVDMYGPPPFGGSAGEDAGGVGNAGGTKTAGGATSGNAGVGGAVGS
jgi:hypothetical protein